MEIDTSRFSGCSSNNRNELEVKVSLSFKELSKMWNDNAWGVVWKFLKRAIKISKSGELVVVVVVIVGVVEVYPL